MGINKSEMVTIFLMGKKHRVPSNLTIMKAMEYSGHHFKRVAGGTMTCQIGHGFIQGQIKDSAYEFMDDLVVTRA